MKNEQTIIADGGCYRVLPRAIHTTERGKFTSGCAAPVEVNEGGWGSPCAYNVKRISDAGFLWAASRGAVLIARSPSDAKAWARAHRGYGLCLSHADAWSQTDSSGFTLIYDCLPEDHDLGESTHKIRNFYGDGSFRVRESHGCILVGGC